MLRRSVNGEAGCALQASSPPLDQSKQEQEEGEGELAAYPDNFCDGRQDLTFTSSCLAKRSRQIAKKETSLTGDNLRIYLNDDPEVVARYREEYLRGEAERLERCFGKKVFKNKCPKSVPK